MTVGFDSGKIESYFPNLCYQRVSATGTVDYNQLKGLLNDIEDNIICNGGVVLVFENPNRRVRHAVTVVKDSVSGLYYVYDPGYLNSAFNGWELEDYMSHNYVGFYKDATTTYTEPKYIYEDIYCIHYFSVGFPENG